MSDDCRLLLQTFDEYLAGFFKRVGKDRTYSSYNDYRKRRNRLAAFLEYEYRVKDIPFKELKRDFIEKFVVYLFSVQAKITNDKIGQDMAVLSEKLDSVFKVAQ